MYQPSSERSRNERSELVSAAVALALLALLFVAFAFTPARDPSKVVAGIPCSIFSENQIGAVFGSAMRLRPTDGTVCQYVSIDPDKQGMLFVIARHDDPASSRLAGRGLAVHYHGRIYNVIAIADAAHPGVAALQQRLALILDRRLIAKRR